MIKTSLTRKEPSLDDLTPEEIDHAINMYATFKLSTGDLEKLGFSGYGEIIGHLNRLGLKIPVKPIELEPPEWQEMRRRSMADMTQELKEQEKLHPEKFAAIRKRFNPGYSPK